MTTSLSFLHQIAAALPHPVTDLAYTGIGDFLPLGIAGGVVMLLGALLLILRRRNGSS